MEQNKKNALKRFFGKLKKGVKGDQTPHFGHGDENTTDIRDFNLEIH